VTLFLAILDPLPLYPICHLVTLWLDIFHFPIYNILVSLNGKKTSRSCGRGVQRFCDDSNKVIHLKSVTANNQVFKFDKKSVKKLRDVIYERFLFYKAEFDYERLRHSSAKKTFNYFSHAFSYTEMKKKRKINSVMKLIKEKEKKTKARV